MELSCWEAPLLLKAPLRTAYATLTRRTVLFVALADGEGAVGYGEAAPLTPYDGTTLEEVKEALSRYRPQLRDTRPPSGLSPVKGILARLHRVAPCSHALSAASTALLDLLGKRSSQPLFRLLGLGGEAPAVAVNAAIEGVEPEEAARRAAQAVQRGFAVVKVKVGVGADGARVAAVRAAAPALRIRVDANGAWREAEAPARLAALARYSLELCEEPVHGLGALSRLQQITTVPLVADESAPPNPSAAKGVAGICLRLPRYGGPLGLLAAGRQAQREGLITYLSSAYEGPLGVWAALQVATVLAGEGALAASGLASAEHFQATQGWPQPQHGLLQAPPTPGLGAEPPLSAAARPLW